MKPFPHHFAAFLQRLLAQTLSIITFLNCSARQKKVVNNFFGSSLLLNCIGCKGGVSVSEGTFNLFIIN
eukprot:m.109671 g.109671  ORF g.109671 m.109671 type:complete len:69 (-) comp14009_c0_seq1:81-287(-)